MYIEGKKLNGNFHFKRLKQAFLTMKGQVSTLADLKQILDLGIKISE